MSLNACQSTLQYMVCGKCAGDMSKKKGHWQEGAGMERSEVAFVESSEWPVLLCSQRICGKFHYVLEVLQQMERLFTHQSASRQTDKGYELCIIIIITSLVIPPTCVKSVNPVALDYMTTMAGSAAWYSALGSHSGVGKHCEDIVPSVRC